MNLSSTFVVLHPDQSATPVELTPTMFEDVNRRFDGFERRILVSCCLLSGRVSLVLEGKDPPIELRDAGAYVIVPKGTWHTAKTSVPTTMLFVTPGAGTEHKPVG